MIGIEAPAWLWPLLAAPFVGSFMGVLIIRLPAGAPVVFSRSACPHCGTRLNGWELVPLASFVTLRGRCRHCRQPIGRFHPAVELAAVVVAAWAALADPDPLRLWADCGLGWSLLTLAWIDCTSFLLPDVLTLPLLLAGLALTLDMQPEALTDRCLAAMFGYLSFQGLAFAYRRLRGRHGLGGGDAKLLAAAGAWCGLALLPFVILGSAVAGLLAALGLALTGRPVTSRTRIPFGPCIAVAFWLAWLHGGLLDQLLGRP
ncbi:prepilin peptidase [Rhodopila sp.]|uniref:prepilin peptidase n=1 Tax=Rhodopila sp. TaxID=2480087 RepID=UPI003D0D7E8B